MIIHRIWYFSLTAADNIIYSSMLDNLTIPSLSQGFDQTREGISRPGHFRGVATVVTKLFNIIQPTNAYFGQKDAVQCVVIRRIARDLDMDINVISWIQ